MASLTPQPLAPDAGANAIAARTLSLVGSVLVLTGALAFGVTLYAGPLKGWIMLNSLLILSGAAIVILADYYRTVSVRYADARADEAADAESDA